MNVSNRPRYRLPGVPKPDGFGTMLYEDGMLEDGKWERGEFINGSRTFADHM